jgi:hypothetical protein
MKKIAKIAAFVLVLFFSSLFVSCKYERGSLINDSDYTVSGETTWNRKFTLSPGESETIASNEYTKNFSATPPRVSMKEEGDNLVFYNTPAISLYVYNIIDKPVELYAQNCIGDGSEPVTIAENGTTILNIYNSTPVFTAFFEDSGVKYPVIVAYTYDPVKNQATATIR